MAAVRRSSSRISMGISTSERPESEIAQPPRRGGKCVVKVKRNILGATDGGDPETEFKNFSGNIYI
jgi:hypothetical protein